MISKGAEDLLLKGLPVCLRKQCAKAGGQGG